MDRPMLCHLISLALVAVATLFSIIAIATPYWQKSIDHPRVVVRNSGLFETCSAISADADKQCQSIYSPQGHIIATRAFMIMGCIFLGFTAIATILLLREILKKGNIFAVVLAALAFLWLLIGCSVYTGGSKPLSLKAEFGYSFGLAWASCVISLLAIPFAFLARQSEKS